MQKTVTACFPSFCLETGRETTIGVCSSTSGVPNILFKQWYVMLLSLIFRRKKKEKLNSELPSSHCKYLPLDPFRLLKCVAISKVLKFYLQEAFVEKNVAMQCQDQSSSPVTFFSLMRQSLEETKCVGTSESASCWFMWFRFFPWISLLSFLNFSTCWAFFFWSRPFSSQIFVSASVVFCDEKTFNNACDYRIRGLIVRVAAR